MLHNKQMRRYYLPFAVENCKLGLRKAKKLGWDHKGGNSQDCFASEACSCNHCGILTFSLTFGWNEEGFTRWTRVGEKKIFKTEKAQQVQRQATKTMILKRRNFWWSISYTQRTCIASMGHQCPLSSLKNKISPKWGHFYILLC